LRRLVRDTLEYGHSGKIFDHCRGLLYTDHDLVRDACQAFQRDALSLRHATENETVGIVYRVPVRVWRLMVKRTIRKKINLIHFEQLFDEIGKFGTSFRIWHSDVQ
jgi:hypothetical protein